MIKYKGFILSHCPIHESEMERYYKNIHGHVHEETIKDDRYINVCCEAINYTPVCFSTIQNK
jgi:calcineurin-like phosphoesterase family protein